METQCAQIEEEAKLIVCMECWNEIAPPRMSQEDGPLVCTHCGATDGPTYYMTVSEFEETERTKHFPLRFIRRMIEDFASQLARLNDRATELLGSGIIENYDEAPPLAIKILALRAEVFEWKELLRRREEHDAKTGRDTLS